MTRETRGAPESEAIAADRLHEVVNSIFESAGLHRAKRISSPSIWWKQISAGTIPMASASFRSMSAASATAISCLNQSLSVALDIGAHAAMRSGAGCRAGDGT